MGGYFHPVILNGAMRSEPTPSREQKKFTSYAETRRRKTEGQESGWGICALLICPLRHSEERPMPRRENLYFGWQTPVRQLHFRLRDSHVATALLLGVTDHLPTTHPKHGISLPRPTWSAIYRATQVPSEEGIYAASLRDLLRRDCFGGSAIRKRLHSPVAAVMGGSELYNGVSRSSVVDIGFPSLGRGLGWGQNYITAQAVALWSTFVLGSELYNGVSRNSVADVCFGVRIIKRRKPSLRGRRLFTVT